MNVQAGDQFRIKTVGGETRILTAVEADGQGWWFKHGRNGRQFIEWGDLSCSLQGKRVGKKGN